MGQGNDTVDQNAVTEIRSTSPKDDDATPCHEEFHELVVDGTLDLHIFRPKDIKILVPDYLEECREKGILYVRIIHGKGTGTLRRTVYSILERLPFVASYNLASESEGGWGATIVRLNPCEGRAPRKG